MKGNPVNAATYLLKGFKLIQQPGIRPFVIIPLILNILVYVTILGVSIQKFSTWIDSWMAEIPEWLDFLDFILWPMFIFVLLILVAYTFTIVANFISSPFNGFLAEKVELYLCGQTAETPGGWRELLAIVPRSIKRELAKLLHYLPWLIAVWIISLIPVINAVAPILWFLLGAWMMAIQYVDYPMDNHQIVFSEMKQRLRERGLSSLGFGITTLVASMIPLINFIVIPAAICGATQFWVEELKTAQDGGTGQVPTRS